MVVTDEMTWSDEGKESTEAAERTEEAAVSNALKRAFRAVDEEVVGSVSTLSFLCHRLPDPDVYVIIIAAVRHLQSKMLLKHVICSNLLMNYVASQSHSHVFG